MSDEEPQMDRSKPAELRARRHHSWVELVFEVGGDRPLIVAMEADEARRVAEELLSATGELTGRGFVVRSGKYRWSSPATGKGQ